MIKGGDFILRPPVRAGTTNAYTADTAFRNESEVFLRSMS